MTELKPFTLGQTLSQNDFLIKIPVLDAQKAEIFFIIILGNGIVLYPGHAVGIFLDFMKVT